jgi:hypothetical protein
MNSAALPPLLGLIEIPRTFTVTAVCAANACKLRMLAASDPRLDRLGSGPKASAGSLYHALIHEWALASDADPAQYFDSRAEAWDDELRQSPRTAHQAPLRSTMSGVDWITFKRKALAAMIRARNPATPVIPRSPLARPAGSQREHLFESDTLRLRGKPDLIRFRGPANLEIRDFKSGLIWQEDGKLKASIALQMHAYGLLIAEREPGTTIKLVVDDGEAIEVPFDHETRTRARNRIDGLFLGLEAGRRVNAGELASPGSDCSMCAIRHLCPAYRAAAPLWWRALPQDLERIPEDTWGNITAVETGSFGVRVRLTDAAGRSVQIDSLSPRHGFEFDDIGRSVWFFGLTVRGHGRSPDGIRFQPHNFFEFPRDGRDRRAWALEVFA